VVTETSEDLTVVQKIISGGTIPIISGNLNILFICDASVFSKAEPSSLYNLK